MKAKDTKKTLNPAAKAMKLLETCRYFGARIMKTVAEDGKGNPVGAIIVIDGAETVKPILEAIEKLEKEWDEKEKNDE